MPTNPKTKKNPKNPSDMGSDELRELLLEVAESLRDAKTIDDRRELVARLLARQVRRSRIVAICVKGFGIKPNAVDMDIRWVKDWMAKGVKEAELDALRGECIGSMNEVVSVGFTRGDLGSVVSATRHKAQLMGLIDESINVNASANATAGQTEELRREVERKITRLSKPAKA